MRQACRELRKNRWCYLVDLISSEAPNKVIVSEYKCIRECRCIRATLTQKGLALPVQRRRPDGVTVLPERRPSPADLKSCL